MKSLFIAIIIAFAVSAGFSQNEQSPLVEKDISYKEWKLKDVRTGNDVKLRDLIKGQKLVAVVYFAPWCPNWKHDAPMLERFYEKYHSAGFEIIAVGEYDPVASMKGNIDTMKLTFPMVYESENRDQREKTLHHDYRTATGDTRKWGSPWYIFEPSMLEKKGDVLTKKTHVINGEMIETEGELFIRTKLGFAELDKPAVATAKSETVEVCDPKDKKTELKKP